MLLLTLIFIVIFGGIFAALYGFSDVASTLTGLNPQFMSGSNLVFFFISSVFIAALISPINAGLIKMAHLAQFDKNIGLDTLFQYYKAPYFKELFTAAVVIAFAGNGINYVLQYFGIMFWGALVTYGIAFLTFLTIPLIIFSNLKAMEAINMSVKLVLKQPLILLGLLILSIVLVCCGFFGFLYWHLFYYPILIFNVFYHLCGICTFL